MRKLHVFLLSTLVLALAACGGGSSPADIEMSMWKKIQSGDYEKAVELWYDNSEHKEGADPKEVKEFIKAFSEKIKVESDKKGGIQSVKLDSETFSEDGQTATVSVTVTYKDGTTDSQKNDYKKIDGKWKMENSK